MVKKMKSNLISVIVPFYNAESFLKTCIDSILSQTYLNIELLLIDDGSTDNSKKIYEEYQKKDNRIRVYKIKNSGQGIARNEGLEHSLGDFVTFMDVDDYMEDNCVELLAENIEDSVDLVIGGYKRFSNGKEIYKEQYHQEIVKKPSENLIYQIQGANPWKKDQVKGTVWNSLYRKKVIDENKIYFKSEKEIFSEDTLFNVEFLKKCGNVKLITSTAYRYIINSNSTTNKYDGQKLEKISKYYDYMVSIFKKNDQEAIIRNQSFYIFNLKKCILQEKGNPYINSISDLYFTIKNISKDKRVIEILNEYPISTLNIKTRTLMYMLKYKYCLVLAILVFFKQTK